MLLFATPLGLLCGWFAHDFVMANLKFITTTAEEGAAIRAEVAAQDETAFYKPARSPRSIQPANPLNNVYLGDLHIHSNLSIDAHLFGDRRDLDATSRFAKGDSAPIETGEIIEIARPLDFAAITDHAEGFGSVMACVDPERPGIAESCELVNDPNLLSFLELRANVENRPLVENLT